ncbi:hypothetical protein AAA597_17795 [Pseudomonas aeruginosa]
MSSTQHQLIEQCATRLRGIVEALDNIHDTSPHRWSTDLDDVHSSAESLLALIKDQAPARSEASFEEWLANELEGEDGQPVPAAVCDIALARRAFNHWPKLEQPAKVGGVRFSAGVSSRLVVEAAQRLYEFESTPEKEAERIDPEQELVEQAGGDERAAFELFVRKHCGMPAHIAVNWDAKFTNDAWEGWQARAALAQPSPKCATCNDSGQIVVSGPHYQGEFQPPEYETEPCDMCAQPSPAQAEAERLREAYEWGYGDGQNNPNGYSDKKERDACVNELLKQPSPAQAEGAPVIGCLCGMPMTEGHHSQDGCSSLEEFAQHSAQAQAEQGEAAGCQGTNCGTTTGDHSPECLAEAAASQGWELKPEDLGEVDVVAYLATAEHPKHGQPHKAINYSKYSHDAQVAHWRARGCTVTEDQLMTVSQHASSVALWADLFNRVQRERDAALARVAELEGKLTDWVHEGFRLNEALAIAQAQHSVPEGWMLVPVEPLLNMMSDKDHDTRITAERQLLSILAAAPGNSVPQAWLDVQAERRRQITAEGWTPEHDDAHSHGQMARAAACYALAGSSAPSDGTAALLVSLAWPWDEQWWKPSTARRDLVKACALALAEIERLDRAAASQGGPSDA